MENFKNYSWVILFLIKAVDAYFEDAKAMLDEILENEFSEKTGVYICLNAKIGSLKKIDKKYIPPKGMKDEDNITAFYSIDSSDQNFSVLNFKKDTENFNIRDANSVRFFLKEGLIDKCPDDAKFLLFTWDHGSVFGIFREAERLGEINPSNKLLSRIDTVNDKIVFGLASNNRIFPKEFINFKFRKIVDEVLKINLNSLDTNSFNNIAEDFGIQNRNKKNNKTNFLSELNLENKVSFLEMFDSSFSFKSGNNSIALLRNELTPSPEEFDMLTMDELNQAIQWAFGKKHIDVLIMMNCCMQFFDTGLTLSNSVNFLVAPETTMYFSGYNYKAIFQEITKNSETLSAKNLAKIAVSSFADKQDMNMNINSIAKESVAIFGNELKYYNDIADNINNIAIKLINKIDKDEFDDIFIAREKCLYLPETGSYRLVDFYNILEKLVVQKVILNTDSNFINLLELRNLVTDNQQREFIGRKLIDEKGESKINPSCFSICYPIFKDHFDSDFFNIFIDENSILSTIFSKCFNWDNFLRKYRMKTKFSPRRQ